MIKFKLSGIISGLGLVLLFMGIAFAQEELVFTVKEAQQYALENNYDVRNARLNIEAAEMQRWEVTASGFPQVEASLQYQKLLDIPTQLIPGEIFGGEPGSTIPVRFGKPHNATYGVSVSQLIFNGSYLVGLRASGIYQKLSEQAHESTQLDVQETVAQTCYLILVAEENRRILQTSLENLRQTNLEISAMHQEGFVEETDVKQLNISVTGLETSITSLDQQIGIAYQLLKMQLGLESDQPVGLKDSLHTLIDQLDVQGSLEREFDLQNNITYKLLLTQEHLADLSLDNEKISFLPTIAAFASAQRNAQRDEFNLFDSGKQWFPTTVVGVQVSWPIFSGGQKLFRIQKARVELEQAGLKRQQAELGLRLVFNQAQTELSTAFKKYNNTRNNKLLAKDIYDINLIKYKEGMVSSLDLIQSHNQYLQSESEYMMAVSDLLNAQNKMDKLLENY